MSLDTSHWKVVVKPKDVDYACWQLHLFIQQQNFTFRATLVDIVSPSCLLLFKSRRKTSDSDKGNDTLLPTEATFLNTITTKRAAIMADTLKKVPIECCVKFVWIHKMTRKQAK